MKFWISQNREGFRVLKSEFTIPDDTRNLDPQLKRAVTICNVFANHHYSIRRVARLLDEDHRNVVFVLLKNGIIKDRRVRQMKLQQRIERRETVLSPN